MLFLRLPHTPAQNSGLLQPSFAYVLANPEERSKVHAKENTKAISGNSEATTNNGVIPTRYMDVSEEDDRFILYTDLPGVKAKDLTVELTSAGVLRIHGQRNTRSQQPVAFDRQFLLDDKHVDSSKIAAIFSDGCLEIVAPKKKPAEPRVVPVVAGKAVFSDDNDEAIRKFDVDVPGVKVADLKVQIDGDYNLVIAGERKRGGNTEHIRRAFVLDSKAVDLEKLQAFLEDGVLTVRMPVKAPREGRVIPLNSAINQDTHETSTAPVETTSIGAANVAVPKNKKDSDDGTQAEDHGKTEESFHHVQAEEAESTNSNAPEKDSTHRS